ncbi:MAG: hypothetical protein Q9227_005716 [Pyrenula ochraceoflavens]
MAAASFGDEIVLKATRALNLDSSADSLPLRQRLALQAQKRAQRIRVDVEWLAWVHHSLRDLNLQDFLSHSAFARICLLDRTDVPRPWHQVPETSMTESDENLSQESEDRPHDLRRKLVQADRRLSSSGIPHSYSSTRSPSPCVAETRSTNSDKHSLTSTRKFLPSVVYSSFNTSGIIRSIDETLASNQGERQPMPLQSVDGRPRASEAAMEEAQSPCGSSLQKRAVPGSFQRQGARRMVVMVPAPPEALGVPHSAEQCISTPTRPDLPSYADRIGEQASRGASSSRSRIVGKTRPQNAAVEQAPTSEIRMDIQSQNRYSENFNRFITENSDELDTSPIPTKFRNDEAYLDENDYICSPSSSEYYANSHQSLADELCVEEDNLWDPVRFTREHSRTDSLDQRSFSIDTGNMLSRHASLSSTLGETPVYDNEEVTFSASSHHTLSPQLSSEVYTPSFACQSFGSSSTARTNPFHDFDFAWDQNSEHRESYASESPLSPRSITLPPYAMTGALSSNSNDVLDVPIGSLSLQNADMGVSEIHKHFYSETQDPSKTRPLLRHRYQTLGDIREESEFRNSAEDKEGSHDRLGQRPLPAISGTPGYSRSRILSVPEAAVSYNHGRNRRFGEWV